MAQPKRFTRHSVTWQYTGQSKKHTLTYYSALHPEDDAEVQQRNAEFTDNLAEFAGACDTGTAQIVAHNTEPAS